MKIGTMFEDTIDRKIYDEIAQIEEKNVTQYECLIDPNETWLEKWLLHEATEVYNYLSCVKYETNKLIKKICELFVYYELFHLHFVMYLFQKF